MFLDIEYTPFAKAIARNETTVPELFGVQGR
jgi:hypothetical protein